MVGLRLPLQTDALWQEAPGLFLALPRGALLLFLGAFGLQDCFSCWLSLPSLSPLAWVNNGVNEAGGGRFGCCMAAHSRCGGKCVCMKVLAVVFSFATSGALESSLWLHCWSPFRRHYYEQLSSSV